MALIKEDACLHSAERLFQILALLHEKHFYSKCAETIITVLWFYIVQICFRGVERGLGFRGSGVQGLWGSGALGFRGSGPQYPSLQTEGGHCQISWKWKDYTNKRNIIRKYEIVYFPWIHSNGNLKYYKTFFTGPHSQFLA